MEIPRSQRIEEPRPNGDIDPDELPIQLPLRWFLDVLKASNITFVGLPTADITRTAQARSPLNRRPFAKRLSSSRRRIRAEPTHAVAALAATVSAADPPTSQDGPG
jgi:hypothetical protein